MRRHVFDDPRRGSLDIRDQNWERVLRNLESQFYASSVVSIVVHVSFEIVNFLEKSVIFRIFDINKEPQN